MHLLVASYERERMDLSRVSARESLELSGGGRIAGTGEHDGLGASCKGRGKRETWA